MSTLIVGFNKWMTNVRKQHKQRTIAAADYAYRRIVALSPVRSGAYRANHNRTVGAPDHSFDPSKISGQAPRVISPKDFDDYYIANGAPYAGVLENGHSQQAPGGIYNIAANDVRNRYG